MKYFNLISGLLSGKKTYIIGILLIVLGFYQGDDKTILEGIGFLTLRAGINKIGQ